MCLGYHGSIIQTLGSPEAVVITTHGAFAADQLLEAAFGAV